MADIHRQRSERLTEEQKQEAREWLDSKKPADFGLQEAYIWTAKHLVKVVEQQICHSPVKAKVPPPPALQYKYAGNRR